MKAQNLAKLPYFKEFQYDVFKRFGKDSRTPGLPESENTQGQRERLLVSSTETLFGLHVVVRLSLQPTSAAKHRPTRVQTYRTRYHPRHRLPTVKSGSIAVTVHGSFSGEEFGPFHHIKGDMDFKIYINNMEAVN
ncbi:hypothetical protein TELCIR_18789 [Teladorsagia circumcincta]|uniref:Uncharacterized protein n=1 Tax=Teladorsagia circumcincta TaxID=45464 RepID=A0A2G9TPB3_TELCI|nr:hypothetical protein TELCIR_18789 [Teladorsagia circumcincta]